MTAIVSLTRLALALLVAHPTLASAQATVLQRELRVWTARAIATVLAEVGPQFERASGYTLVVSSDLPGEFSRRANAGEPFDVLISASAPVDEWIRNGTLIGETRIDIARSGIGVQVRSGARKPDISSVDAFKRALLDAKSIAFLKVGSGIYLASLLERLGIADSVTPKVTRPDSDIVSELVAKGEVELGIVVITQILTSPGVDLVGPLPPAIQSYITFSGGVSARTRHPDAARRLLAFLTGPAAVSVMKAQGMEPAR
jgi:molybdate transport system substrate-binding protein